MTNTSAGITGITAVQTSPTLEQNAENVAVGAIDALTGGAVPTETVQHAVDHASTEIAHKAGTFLHEFPHVHLDILQIAERVVGSCKQDFYQAEDKVKAVVAAADAFLKHIESKI